MTPEMIMAVADAIVKFGFVVFFLTALYCVHRWMMRFLDESKGH